MAHTFGNSLREPATLTSTSTTNPLAFNFTCVAGSTVLVLMLSYAGNTARSGGPPTYNGVELTQADTNRGVTEASSEIWYLLAPPTGSALSISIPNSGGLAMGAVVATANAQSGYRSIYDNVGQTATTGSGPSVTVASTAGGVIFAVVSSGDNGFNPTARTGTNLYQGDAGAWGYGTQYLLETTTGSRAMSWTEATSDDYGAIAVSFKEELIVAVTHEGVSALNATSSLITAGSVTHATHEGVATLNAASSLVSAGSLTHATHEGAATLNATSSLVVAGSITHATHEGAATLNATSSLVTEAIVSGPIHEGGATLNSASSLVSIGSVIHTTHESAETLNATSSLVVTGSITHATYEGVATLNVTSSLVIAGSITHATHEAESLLNETSSLIVSGLISIPLVEGEIVFGCISYLGTIR